MTSRVVLASALVTGLNLQYSLGVRRGDATGWPSLDEHFTVAPGQMTVITGWPGSGKSEWLDALLCHLCGGAWRACYYSPENWPVSLHLSKLVEKWSGVPFSAGPTERLTWAQARAVAEESIGDRMAFICGDETDNLGVDEILDRASEYFVVMGEETKRALVIDPWNEVGHMRPSDMTETEYISWALTRIRKWSRAMNVHTFIVAHPAKQRREDGKLPVPRPDMIAGSQHWWNKADNCITVLRHMDDPTKPVEVHVQKVRFKHIGRIGMVELAYDRVTGRYSEPARDAEGREIGFSFGGAA